MVHWPGALPNQTEAFVEGIGDVLDANLAVAGGVSNFKATRVESAAKALKERGHCLASNQVQYSLLYRTVREDKNTGPLLSAFSLSRLSLSLSRDPRGNVH